VKKPAVALLINMFVLPGMGQFYIGQKGKGIAIIAVTNILLAAGFILFLKIMLPVLGTHIKREKITAAQILQQVLPYALWAKLILASMLATWIYAVADSIATMRKTG